MKLMKRNNNTKNEVVKRDDFFDDFFKEIDSFFGNFWDDMPLMRSNEKSFAVDIVEDDKKFTVKAELPGVKEDDLKVTLENNLLTISGEKKEEKEEKGKNYYRKECFSGTFSRSFSLPENIDVDKIDATYKNGVLTIDIPKSEEKNNKKEIKIKK